MVALSAQGSRTEQLLRDRPRAGFQYPILRCADGYVRLCLLAKRQWRGMFRWMGEPEQFAAPEFDRTSHRYASPDLLPYIAAFFANRRRADLEHEGHEHGVPIASVLTLGESSQLRLDEQVAGPAPQSTFQLLFGRIRAIATERYGTAGARFELKTPTAIAGVRGTEFVAQHDAAEDETLVVGIVDTTMVRAAVDAQGDRVVRLGPGQSTRIRRGNYPTPARAMPASQIRSLVDATATKKGDLGAKKGEQPATQAEPRLPSRPGDRDGSPVERVVDDPFVRGKGPQRPAPPPPPPPGN